MLKKVVDLSNQNLKRNADGLLAKQVHNNDSLLWPGGKHVPNDKFSVLLVSFVVKKFFNYVSNTI